MKNSIQLSIQVLLCAVCIAMFPYRSSASTSKPDSMTIERTDQKIRYTVSTDDPIVLELGFWSSVSGRFIRKQNDSIWVAKGKKKLVYAISDIKTIGLYGGSRTKAIIGQTLGFMGSLGMTVATTSTLYEAANIHHLEKDQVQGNLYLFMGSSIVLTAGSKLAQYERLKLKKGNWNVL